MNWLILIFGIVSKKKSWHAEILAEVYLLNYKKFNFTKREMKKIEME